MAIARGFNGVGLALMVPAMNSLAADYSDDTTRGSAFGWLGMASRLGAMTGGTLRVLLAPTTFLGVPGWRLAFHILALLSVALAVSTWFLASDPRPPSTSEKSTATVARELAMEARDVVRLPTFQILVAQGVAGPILAEIVPEKARTTVYALDRFFETIFSSFAPAVVGILAERVFGYQPASGGTGKAERENAAALAKAVFAEIAVPMAICCSIYSLLYCTYPSDRQRAQKAALVAPEEEDCEHAASSTPTGVDGLNQALLARSD
ncbi:unnamed protein product [Triticum turgidum subsp. durum]|uniref:Major facilitator superfamily (MFS) profile domain-containing protein n=1 Tax=Triticum turgidum subsp. durum TaxID=4567 RepID=A0A9R0S5J2_TRITD|nr:unnamed protein product [Triticum turgidum subsp. durum]